MLQYCTNIEFTNKLYKYTLNLAIKSNRLYKNFVFWFKFLHRSDNSFMLKTEPKYLIVMLYFRFDVHKSKVKCDHNFMNYEYKDAYVLYLL